MPERYKDSIKKLIMVDSPWINEEDNREKINSLMLSLSFYMDRSSHAYKYNMAFLPAQCNKFVDFIIKARVKRKLLQDVVEEIIRSETVKKHLNYEERNKVHISINDLIISNLNGDINLHEMFSIDGGKRKAREDIFTIKYEHENKEKRELIKRILSKRVEIKYKKNKDGETIETDSCLPLINLTKKVLGLEKPKNKGEESDVNKD